MDYNHSKLIETVSFGGSKVSDDSIVSHNTINSFDIDHSYEIETPNVLQGLSPSQVLNNEFVSNPSLTYRIGVESFLDGGFGSLNLIQKVILSSFNTDIIETPNIVKAVNPSQVLNNEFVSNPSLTYRISVESFLDGGLDSPITKYNQYLKPKSIIDGGTIVEPVVVNEQYVTIPSINEITIEQKYVWNSILTPRDNIITFPETGGGEISTDVCFPILTTYADFKISVVIAGDVRSSFIRGESSGSVIKLNDSNGTEIISGLITNTALFGNSNAMLLNPNGDTVINTDIPANLPTTPTNVCIEQLPVDEVFCASVDSWVYTTGIDNGWSITTVEDLSAIFCSQCSNQEVVLKDQNGDPIFINFVIGNGIQDTGSGMKLVHTYAWDVFDLNNPLKIPTTICFSNEKAPSTGF